MSLTCKRLWTALQILWSTLYVVCGAFQLMVAVFFLISVSELRLYSVLFAGSWNIIIGIAGGMVACISATTPRRQETLLYLAVTILLVNIVTLLLTEYNIYTAEMPKLLNNYPNHMLIDYAFFVIRVAVATVILVAFADSQFAFCSAQSLPPTRDRKNRGSHDQVSDIEYIIPRSKPSKSQSHQFYDAYAQSWVFDAENPSSSTGAPSTETSYLKVTQNGTPKNPLGRPNGLQNGSTVKEVTPHLIDNPVVHVEEASEDGSNSDRKLCHMKSFSRSASPVMLSAGSSQISLNYNPNAYNPPIYEYLEKLTDPEIYRSRLNTAMSSRGDETPQYQAPQAVTMRWVETVSPQVVEPIQYASLMKELQRAIVCKKEPPSVTSPLSNSESQSHSKSSNTEFSKELEAALQLIQDLESPNTGETPSDPPRIPYGWRKSSAASESEKTLSAVGSIAEIASPLNELPAAPNAGKGANVTRVHHLYPDSQSTSGYSSPSHAPTPNWSTTSSVNGSHNDIVSTTVITLGDQANGKSVTLVKISADPDPFKNFPDSNVHSSTLITPHREDSISLTPSSDLCSSEQVKTHTWQPKNQHQGIWNVRSLLRKKKQNSLPKLCPELEGAIVKSESLAYLSEVELLARHKRNEEIQRQIERRVIQQLGGSRSESHC